MTICVSIGTENLCDLLAVECVSIDVGSGGGSTAVSDLFFQAVESIGGRSNVRQREAAVHHGG